MSLPKDIKEKFDWVVSFMVTADRFCFQILSMMDKVADSNIPTMGVRPTAIGVELRFNPEFVRSLENEELRYVLAHEVMHVALQHITKRVPSEPEEAELFNIAADLAINSTLKDEYSTSTGHKGSRYAPRYKEDIKDAAGNIVKKVGDRMGCFPEDDEFKFDPELSMENYVHLLRSTQKEQEKQDKDCPVHGEGEGDNEGDSPGNGGDNEGDSSGNSGGGEGDGEDDSSGNAKGSGHSHGDSGKKCTCKGHGGGQSTNSFDSHEGWEPNEVVSEQIRRQIEHIDKSNSWGNMSGSMIEQIKAAQRSEVNWRKLLRHYLGQLVTSNILPTFKRPNKRFGYPYSGSKRGTTDRKLVAIDTSGSVGSAELAKFLTEINSLSQIQPVDLMLFDTELQYKKAIPFDKKKASFKFDGRGGTYFTPVFEYAKKHRYKSLILLTDGFAEAVEKPGRMDVLWVLTPDGRKPVDWGREVKIKKVTD